MTLIRRTLAVGLAVLFMVPAVNAQSTVIGKAALDKAVQQRVASDQADREAIQTSRPKSPPSCPISASRSRWAAAGGASTIVISTTTIIIVLLLVILIIAIAD